MTAAAAALGTVRPRTEVGDANRRADDDRTAGTVREHGPVGWVASGAGAARRIGWGAEARGISSPAAAGTMGSTLVTLTQRLWEGLWAGGAPCPVCSGQLRLDNGRGVCNTCGTTLS
jgi:hypothetical protein